MVLVQLLLASTFCLTPEWTTPSLPTSGMPGPTFGITSCWTGDWNGDGRRDIAVAEPWRNMEPEFIGRVEVLCGVSGAVLHVFEGTKEAPQLGRALVGVPDVDGDGIDDVLAAALGSGPADEDGVRAFELVLLGSRGKVVRTIDYPEPRVRAVEMRAVPLPGAPSGTPSGFGLLISVLRRDKSAVASWGMPLAGDRYEPLWVCELGAPWSTLAPAIGHVPASPTSGALCLLSVASPEGRRVIAVERETGKEILRLAPPAGDGKYFGRAVTHLQVKGDEPGHIVVTAPGGCGGEHPIAPKVGAAGQQVCELGPHDTVLWYRADDGQLVARMCEGDFAAHVRRLDKRRHFGDQSSLRYLEAIPQRSGGERASDLLVAVDEFLGDGIALVMDPEQRQPLAVAPASIDYEGWFDDWGRAWSLAIEPTDGIAPPRLLLGTKSPYGGTHSGVLICSSTTGELLLRVVRADP